MKSYQNLGKYFAPLAEVKNLIEIILCMPTQEELKRYFGKLLFGFSDLIYSFEHIISNYRQNEGTYYYSINFLVKSDDGNIPIDLKYELEDNVKEIKVNELFKEPELVKDLDDDKTVTVEPIKNLPKEFFKENSPIQTPEEKPNNKKTYKKHVIIPSAIPATETVQVNILTVVNKMVFKPIMYYAVEHLELIVTVPAKKEEAKVQVLPGHYTLKGTCGKEDFMITKKTWRQKIITRDVMSETEFDQYIKKFMARPEISRCKIIEQTVLKNIHTCTFKYNIPVVAPFLITIPLKIYFHDPNQVQTMLGWENIFTFE